ncbi:uncharacterized protein LOC111458288 [Cucurbita moschata]|uniref:Uncharacterized protein LOC111458288 n=1 Tax=Cucurbita moschata TaxID=3662 RepID=A0A6J1GWT5_CUCMO|nr:uncharacterized protein LOC111458288 [Cucurbita moschata]
MTKRMGSYDLLGKRRDVKHKGRNVVWSVAIDMCLIEVLAMQARNGNIMNRCFNVNSLLKFKLNNQKVINNQKLLAAFNQNVAFPPSSTYLHFFGSRNRCTISYKGTRPCETTPRELLESMGTNED